MNKDPKDLSSDALFLVTGATGMQGGATASCLLEHGHAVRILTRNPGSPAARALIEAGAEAAAGDMGDERSLDAAMQGVRGVFSVQLPDVTGNDLERRHGFALVRSAIKAGVRQFVHTSVAATGRHTRFPRWGSGYWREKYWTDKWDVEEAVRHAGFASWTVLRPAFMMGNFAMPKATFMFPTLHCGEIATALHADTKLDLVSADDVGAFARAAFENPTAYYERNIELASESLTMHEIAAALSLGLGRKVVANPLAAAQALARGLYPGWVNAQEWINEVGYQVDRAALEGYGVPLSSFAQWVARHRAEIRID